MPPTTPPSVPVSTDDPVNAAILSVSEDQIEGFSATPFADIARRSEVPLDTVLARIAAMLEAGVIRRVRQTIMATSLAPGALVAWRVPPEKLNDAFEWMAANDPFTGHVVIRTTDEATAGSQYRLWTTLKVPQGFSMEKHGRLLCEKTGAEAFRLMPAKKMFALGVGHIRRRKLQPGDKSDAPGRVIDTQIVQLDEQAWRVLAAIKRELSIDEIAADPWRARAAEIGLPLEEFLQVGRRLNDKGVIGRFSTFLEHVKKVRANDDQAVTRYNALFHWRVPRGREMAAGLEVGRFHCMTHAYWREGGPEFQNVNIMGVCHGLEKEKVLAHKAAIDEHLAATGIDVDYTSVFWGGRSEIKPSEILPEVYEAWCAEMGVTPGTMRVEGS
ncbi:MAG: Lrp/AsnC family transcriptional regulator [Planctomycetes bacterium]|jgi:DNA-binding Lrp family transcriptional regulator|nr:Lrp/AsnC family transcriptional regulator [Planctomycetota bacterium]